MRLEATDTIRDSLMKMVDGNPGAITVCVNLLKFGEQLAPQGGPAGGMFYILALDEFEIYGSRIWMLYKDVCGENLNMMVAVLIARANEIITQKELDLAINGSGLKLDLDTLMKTVAEKFPKLAEVA